MTPKALCALAAAALMLAPCASSAAVLAEAPAQVAPMAPAVIPALSAAPAALGGNLSASALSGSLAVSVAAPAVSAEASAAALPAALPAAAAPAAQEDASPFAPPAPRSQKAAAPKAAERADAPRARETLDRVAASAQKAGAAFDAASAGGRAVSTDWVDAMIRRDAAAKPALKRLRDIVQRQGFSAAALNGKLVAAHNDHYTVELPESPITDQKQSGRCWDFAGLNVIMTGLLAEGRKLPFNEFSENFVYFFSLLEKSKAYLDQSAALALARAAGKKVPPPALREALNVGAAIDDGGWFEYFEFIVNKYGLAPKSAMPETASSQNSATLLKELQTSLALSSAELQKLSKLTPALAAERAVAVQKRAMNRVWKVLATHLGTPPSEFELREDTPAPGAKGPAAQTVAKVTRYTPRDFARDYVGFKPGDYVVLTNSPSQKKGVVYEVPRSAIGAAAKGGPSYNLRFMDVGAKRLAELVATSIRGGHAVWFASDVIDDVDVKSGIMHPKIFLRDALYGLSKAERRERLTRRASVYYQLNQPDHAMTITGYDQPSGPKGPIVKMKVKNSWGAQVGTGGFFHMYVQWFKDRVFEAIVHKKFLSPAELQAWEGRAKTMKDPDNMF